MYTTLPFRKVYVELIFAGRIIGILTLETC